MERKILHRMLREPSRVTIKWDAVQEIGDSAMRGYESGQEHEDCFQMVGRRVQEGRGKTHLHVDRVIHVGSGSRNAVNITPDQAQEMNDRELEQGEYTQGIAHTHLEHHREGPSFGDLETMADYPESMIFIITKVRRDGSGVLSVVNKHGKNIAYTLEGANGQKQSFSAHGKGKVDVDRLRQAA